jgi:pimeloyl-ACP methyl ester carboxylesterase
MTDLSLQEPAWTPSEADPRLEYASIVVPLDYADPAGRHISIAISRLKAAGGRRRGILVVLNGGPGGIGVGALGRKLPLRFAGTPVHQAYDIIGFDPRGTGDSTPLFCEITKTKSPFDSRPPDSEFPAITADVRERDSGCQRAADGMRRHVSTRNTARDIDMIRGVLGEERLSFAGYAYGTYAAAVYGSMFPQRLDRTVLDSAVNPAWLWRQQFMSQAVAFRENIDLWAEWTSRQPTRFGLGHGAAEVMAAVEEVAAKLAASPVGSLTRTLFDGAMGPGATYRPLWPALAGIVRALRQRTAEADTAEAAEAASALAAVAAGGFTPPSGTLRPGVIDAVTCEAGWPADLETYYADMRTFRDRYPYGFGVMRAGPFDCTFGTFAHPEGLTLIGRACYPPGLVIQAEGDSVTPYQGGRAIAELLGHRMVTVEDEGFHELYAVRGNRAVDDIVDAYLADGILPDQDTRLPGTPRPVPHGWPDAAGHDGRGALAEAIRGYVGQHHLM